MTSHATLRLYAGSFLRLPNNKGENMKIYIGQECDGFFITLVDEGGKEARYRFNQEDTIEDLVNVFKLLGFDDVEYEEVY